MGLDWEREALLASPLLESLRPVLRRCPAAKFPAIADLNALAGERGLRNANGQAIRFVAQENTRPRGFESSYEVRVYREGTVPTRAANWHDLFNALAWIAFPRTKAEINRIHHREMLARAEAGSRGTARDVLTLFDEGGVIVACGEAELAGLLREFRWKDLFWHRRERVKQAMRFFVIGHAICERALDPYKGLTAKALILDLPAPYFVQPFETQLAEADAGASSRLGCAQALASTRNLAPLPLCGVPGWNAANENESFYDDAAVFRPGRRRRA